jgi:hypothetical protein
VHRTHKNIELKLMDSTLPPSEMSKLGKEYSELEKRKDLIDRRADILKLYYDTKNLEELEKTK